MPDGVPMAWMAGLYDHPPLFVAEGDGAYFVDVDGHRYLDMNHADMSMSCGYGLQPIVQAVADQMSRGSQFLLPGEDAIFVSEELARRFGLPYWQYTLSASSANAEAIRLARLATQRQRVVMFDGGYHGHIDDTLDAVAAGETPSGRDDRTLMVQFNDLEALEGVLKAGDVACVIAEPAMTNINVVMPDEDFHAELRRLTRSYGTLLILDEVHTHVCAYGGLTRAWGLSPDILVLGKSIAGGVPLGAFGLTPELAEVMEDNLDRDHWPEKSSEGVATGGTLFGNPLSMAAARATLEHILTEEGHARTARLGVYLADGIEAVVTDAGLPWTVHRLYCRSGVCYVSSLPRNAIEASAAADFRLNRLHRVFLANRGVWEAIVTAGPAVSFAAGEVDMDVYLDVFRDLVKTLTG
jgi:glutamate-1-semialdehyde 2,1-aminomutase